MRVHDIEPWNNSRIVDYYVSCFERRMVIIFKDFEGFSLKEIFDNLEYNYDKWCEDDEGQCCEETLLDKMPKIYKDNIACVIYEEDENKDYEEIYL